MKIDRLTYENKDGVVHVAFFMGKIGSAWTRREATLAMGGWHPDNTVQDNTTCSIECEAQS